MGEEVVTVNSCLRKARRVALKSSLEEQIFHCKVVTADENSFDAMHGKGRIGPFHKQRILGIAKKYN